MMEVGSPSLSRARHIEQAVPPIVDTGLSLGLPAAARDNNGALMSPQGTGLFASMPVPLSNTAGDYITMPSGRDEAPPISSFGQDTRIETGTTLPVGIVDGNQIISTSPPDNGLPPSIPTAAYWMTPTMPQNALLKPILPNVISAKEFDKVVPRDASSESVINAHTAAPFHSEAMRLEVDDRQPDTASQPSYLGESQPSQTNFNNSYSGGEIQLVHDSVILEASDTQPTIAGETQLVNGSGTFDGVKDTFTASAPPLTDAGPSVLHEPLQHTDAQPLQNSFNGLTSQLPIDIPASDLNNVSTGERETDATAEELNGRVSSTVVPTVIEDPEVYPAQTTGQLSLTEEKEDKDNITSEPQPGYLDESADGKSRAEKEKSQDGVAEIGSEDDLNGNAKSLSEQDIQALKGRKVVKKFGRKNFRGEVVDYDAENQWFKVVYEDGDDEDLTLLEVEEILSGLDTESNTFAAKRKRARSKGAVNIQQARKQKATPKKKGSAANKKVPQAKSPQASTKGSKQKAKLKGPAGSALASPIHSQQPTSGAKRKRSSDAKLEMENVFEKQSGKANGQRSAAKALRKTSAKREKGKAAVKKNSATNKKGKSLSKLPVAVSEVETAMGIGEGDKVGQGKGKRRKVDASEDGSDLVGKSVKKAFGGALYSGVVTKFDKKTEYYKVQYEDGDQEDLELEELKAVLIH